MCPRSLYPFYIVSKVQILLKGTYALTSYLGPADITGQLDSVQNSVIVPYSMFI